MIGGTDIEFAVQASADDFLTCVQRSLEAHPCCTIYFEINDTGYVLTPPDFPDLPIREPVELTFHAEEFRSEPEPFWKRKQRVTDIIKFHVQPIHSSRVQVTVKVAGVGKMVTAYYLDLLLFIADSWRNSETARVISKAYLVKHDITRLTEIATVALQRDELVNVLNDFSHIRAGRRESIKEAKCNLSGNTYRAITSWLMPEDDIIRPIRHPRPLTLKEPVEVLLSFRKDEIRWYALRLLVQPLGAEAKLTRLWIDRIFLRPEEEGLVNELRQYLADSQIIIADRLPAIKPRISSGEKQPRREDSKRVGDEVSSWERIEDHNWDRLALELWWKGLSNGEIAKEVGRYQDKENFQAKTVRNRLWQLRKRYGEEIVPTDTTLRELGIK